MTTALDTLWPTIDKPDTTWTQHAKCLGTVTPGNDPFEPGRGHDRKKIATKLCAGCPVMLECAQDALHYRDQGVIRAATFIPNHADGIPLLPGVIGRLMRIAGINQEEVAA